MKTRTRALCTLIAIALAGCGDSPTDTTYADLNGTWEGDGAGYHVRLELVEEPGGSVTVTGQVSTGGRPVQDYDVTVATHRSGRLEIDGILSDDKYAFYFLGTVSPRRDTVDGYLGVAGEPAGRIWLYRR